MYNLMLLFKIRVAKSIYLTIVRCTLRKCQKLVELSQHSYNFSYFYPIEKANKQEKVKDFQRRD